MRVAFGTCVAIAFGAACASPEPSAEVVTCTVESERLDCGAHAYCKVDPDEVRARKELVADHSACDCVAGYTMGAAGCTWTGTVKDPAFMTRDAWTQIHGAQVDTGATGGIDRGEVTFTPEALDALAYVTQTVDMPTFAKAEPLVLELSYKDQNHDLGDQGRTPVPMAVSFGGGWSPLPDFRDDGFHTLRVCVPEGGYAPSTTTGKGAPVALVLGPYLRSWAHEPAFAIDHAEIVTPTAGECGTTFGRAANFDAESEGGWTFITDGTSSGGFVYVMGEGASRAAQITLSGLCDRAEMETWFNVPDVANPALEVFVRSTGVRAWMTFGQFREPIVGPPAGIAATIHTCLPPWLRGQTTRLRFSLQSGGGGSCATILNYTVSADNVRVVDDPACKSTEAVTNAGFEAGGVAFGSFAYTLTAGWAAAVVRGDAGRAHSGLGYLSLESYAACSMCGFTMLPIVPAPTATGGPALKFFADVDANADTSTSVEVDLGGQQALTESGGYRPYTVCLDPRSRGRPQRVRVVHRNDRGGACDGMSYTEQDARLDDIEVTTDPSCPRQ